MVSDEIASLEQRIAEVPDERVREALSRIANILKALDGQGSIIEEEEAKL
jgi:hypothetical protein